MNCVIILFIRWPKICVKAVASIEMISLKSKKPDLKRYRYTKVNFTGKRDHKRFGKSIFATSIKIKTSS
jgi:hypothetical protein